MTDILIIYKNSILLSFKYTVVIFNFSMGEIPEGIFLCILDLNILEYAFLCIYFFRLFLIKY